MGNKSQGRSLSDLSWEVCVTTTQSCSKADFDGLYLQHSTCCTAFAAKQKHGFIPDHFPRKHIFNKMSLKKYAPSCKS